MGDPSGEANERTEDTMTGDELRELVSELASGDAEQPRLADRVSKIRGESDGE